MNTRERETPDFYAELADTLHAIADGFDALAGRGLPRRGDLFVTLTIQPVHRLPDDEKIHAIDAIGTALGIGAGTPRPLSGGSFHHHAEGRRDAVDVAVYAAVDSPEKRALEAELARLRAEVEAARAEAEAGRDELAGGES